MLKFVLGFLSGIIVLYLISKYYCFSNSKEWKKFEMQYLRRKRK